MWFSNKNTSQTTHRHRLSVVKENITFDSKSEGTRYVRGIMTKTCEWPDCDFTKEVPFERIETRMSTRTNLFE